MDSTNFQADVLELSDQKPVVVDFWAPWCGPCQYLGPVIEQLAAEAEGKWELRKVNTDKYPEVSQQYQVRGIPAVKLIHKRKVIAEFTGALPRHQIQDWLDKNLPSKEREEFEQMLQAFWADRSAENLIALETFVQANPAFEEGRVALAAEHAFTNPKRAKELLQDIKKGELMEQVEDLRVLTELIEHEPDMAQPVGIALQKAQAALTTRNFDEGFHNLIDAVMEDKSYQNDLPRRATIALFRYLGSDHELTKKYRRKFDMVLY